MKFKLYPLFFIVLSLFVLSCSKPNNYSEHTAEIIKELSIRASTANENHSVTSSQSSSIITLKVFGDNSIDYQVFIDSAKSANDVVKSVEIRLGDPITENGTLIMSLQGRFRAGYATGVINDVRRTFIDTLLNNNIAKYINVTTGKEPMGLQRGQINADIVYSMNTVLKGENVRPISVSTPTTGLGLIRVTSDLMLYSNIVLSNNENLDPVLTAKLYNGTSEVNGAEILTLAANPGQFNFPKFVSLTTGQYQQLVNSSYYLSASSAMYPNGKIRGQVK